MSLEFGLGGAIALFLLVFFMAALLRPEKF
jgi:K+-transporting ATPase KdpF subunit